MSRSTRSLGNIIRLAVHTSRTPSLRRTPCLLRKLSSTAPPNPPRSRTALPSIALASSLLASTLLVQHATNTDTHGDEQEQEQEHGQEAKYIRLSDVKAHGAEAEQKWIVQGCKVYDITDWIPNHPGGEVILRAAGGVVDPYWDIFTIHRKQDVYDILEQYCIGHVDPRDLVNGRVPADGIEDPFKHDPERDPRLHVRSSKPMNSETDSNDLATFITPNETFFVRNHLWVPEVDPRAFTLDIELPDGEEVSYTLEDLKKKFDPVTVTATLQCSGNRRSHMNQQARPTNGLPWDVGAVSNAEWTGVRLRDVLADAGLAVDGYNEEEVKHIQFQGMEAYGASIPIEKAVSRSGDVLLVYGMNGEEIPRDHGYPLRVVVPGHVAARSVKWLRKIVVTDEESPSQWQQRDYKCFGPNQGSNDVDWSTAPAIQETPVQSAIVSVRDVGSQKHSTADHATDKVSTKEDMIQVEGYAYSGGGRRIIRVDVSTDNGQSWSQAELLNDDVKGHKAWAWRKWRFTVPKQKAGSQFVVKAVDEGYNSQPESYAAQYNFRGNLTNAWHRVGRDELNKDE